MGHALRLEALVEALRKLADHDLYDPAAYEHAAEAFDQAEELMHALHDPDSRIRLQPTTRQMRWLIGTLQDYMQQIKEHTG